MRIARPLPGCECWWAEPTNLGRRTLRRSSDRKCESGANPWSTCAASLQLPDSYTLERGVSETSYRGDWEPPSGTRWPDTCTFCGKRMPRDARKHADVSKLYRRWDPILERDDLVALQGPAGENGLGPEGMLTDAEWMHGTDHVGEDGISLVAVTPGGYIWNVDMPGTGGGRWNRVGDPRRPETLTVTPSIKVGEDDPQYGYHGFLQSGRFTADLGS